MSHLGSSSYWNNVPPEALLSTCRIVLVMCRDVNLDSVFSSLACSKIIHGLALLYVVYTAIVFNLPTLFPVSTQNFNYNPIGVGIFIVFFVGWWVLDARKWFRGPDPVHLIDGGEEEGAKRDTGLGRFFE